MTTRLSVVSNMYENQTTSTYIPNNRPILQFNNINPIEQPVLKRVRVGGNIKNTTAKNKATRSNKHTRSKVSKRGRCKQMKTKKHKRKICKKQDKKQDKK